MATVAIKNLYEVYQLGSIELRVLREMNLSIDQGENVAIMGPSGPAKSTPKVLSIFSEYWRNFCSDGLQREIRFKAGDLLSKN